MRRVSNLEFVMGISVRQLVAAVLMVVLTWANYAVQTHVHGQPVSGAPQMSAQFVAPSSSGSPADKDQLHCPLCQEFLSGGSILTLAFLFVSPILFVADAVLAPREAPAQTAHSHGWRSRGPPSD